MSADVRHVYVHVPFCARRCSYCDFSIAVRRDVPVSEFITALRGELAIRLGSPTVPGEIETLYFGGGTPSHLGPDGVAALLATLRECFAWRADAEVTLEANPDDVSAAAVAAWRRAGVTRVSLGAQSFDARVLEWMRRSHTVAQIETAVAQIRGAGFASWSFDLIFALPELLIRDWDRDLSLALALAPPHLSLYGLTIEPGTPLGKWADRGEVAGPDERRYETEFLAAHTAAAAAGYEHYEVSNFAQPGHRARHNSSYWSGVPYHGFGPSAHAFDGAARRWNVAGYAAWRDAVLAGQDPLAGAEEIGPSERALERLYLGLRTSDGLRLTEREEVAVAPWITAGWASRRGEKLVLTADGWLRLDALVAALALPQPLHIS
jgi:oxygen-independent coproporphyrinogen III oxidase